MADKTWGELSKEKWSNAWSSENGGTSGANLLSAATSILGTSIENAEIKDTTFAENEIAGRADTQFDYGDFDSLMSAYNSRGVKTSYKQEDFMKEGRELGVLSATATGAMTGAQIGGPWGAVIGGAVGLLSSGTGYFVGNHKAKQAAEKLNLAAEEANRRYVSNFATSAENISNSMFNNSLLNLAAEGGFLDNPRFPYLNIAYTRKKMNNKVKPMLTKYAGFGNYYAYGGELPRTGDWSNGVEEIKAGGSHEENPNGGVPMGVDQNGVPNLVEEGEVVFNDYVFSKRLDVPEDLLEQVKLPKKYADKSFADVAKLIQKESAERPNDYISKNGLADSMIKLMTVQEIIRHKKGLTNAHQGNIHEEGDWLDKPDNWLRYAPVIGTGLQTLGDTLGLTNKEDYTNADIIRKAADNIRTVRSRPIGNYMTYTPMDTNYEQIRLGNQSLGTQRNVLNTTSGNRGAALASLLALNSSTGQNMGALYRQALDYNAARKAEAERFNAGINQFNAQQGMQADIYNQRGDTMKAQFATQEARMRDAIESTLSQAKSANKSTFLNNLGLAGKESADWDRILWMINNGILVGPAKVDNTKTQIKPVTIPKSTYSFTEPTITYSPWEGLDEEIDEIVHKRLQENPYAKKCGGKIRRKKGLTY